MQPALSIVIPAYNEEQRLGATLERLETYFQVPPIPLREVLVVDDGSTDGTAQLVRMWQERFPPLRLLPQAQNAGKGWAVRAGMLAAQGELILFMDADSSTDIGELPKLQAAIAAGADIAIGSRDLQQSVIHKHQPFLREMLGRLFNRLVQLLAVPGIHDTQCGFKLFRRDAAVPLFQHQTIRGWTFDVEILFLARQLGFTVAEVPVAWTDAPGSRVDPLRDALHTCVDLLRIRLGRHTWFQRSLPSRADE